MTYRVNYTDITKSPIIVQDGDVDTTTNIGMVGRGYTGFGQVVAENFLHLLENFSDETPPSRPVEGQIWYNNANSSMYYYTVAETWKKVGNVRSEIFEPIINDGEVNGDFWLHTTKNDLYMFSSPNWVLMTNGDISTKVYTRTRRDNATPIGIHKTLEVVVGTKVVAVFSSDLTPWTPNSTGSNAEYLDDGSEMYKIYSSIRLGINLIDRKTITEVTVSVNNPTTTTTSQYVREGDLWINKNSNRLFTYTANAWQRVNNYVKVRAAIPIIENDEQTGDIWINTITDNIYYYNTATSSWEILTPNTTFAITSPTVTDTKNIGDFWINTATQQLFSYNGNQWINLSFQETGTFVITKDRLDINNVVHKTLETIVGGKTVSVSCGDSNAWKPNTNELLYEGGSYAQKFLQISPGENMSNEVGEIIITTELGDAPTGSVVEYDIWKNYGLPIDSRIKVRTTSAWITPTRITNSDTAPTSPTPVKYDVWITLVSYETKVYNGSTWISPTTMYENGTTISNRTSSSKIFNGIAAKQAISGSMIIDYHPFTAGTTYYNGTSLVDGISTPMSTVAGVNAFLYPRQWGPIIKGTVIIEMAMNAITAYSYQIVRRPIDSNGNIIDSSIVQSGNFTGSATTAVKTLIIPFVDVISVFLPSYYPDNLIGPYKVRYSVMLKKTGTSLITSYCSIDLQPLYQTPDSSSSSGGTNLVDYYIDIPS